MAATVTRDTVPWILDSRISGGFYPSPLVCEGFSSAGHCFGDSSMVGSHSLAPPTGYIHSTWQCRLTLAPANAPIGPRLQSRALGGASLSAVDNKVTWHTLPT